MTTNAIGISDLIKSLSDGIRDASAETQSHQPVIQLEDCEIELAVTASVSGGGALKFSIISVGADASSSTVSKIKLRFKSLPGKASQFAQTDSNGDAPPIPDRV